MDAMPDYTLFNKTRKILCAVQIVEDAISGGSAIVPVFGCDETGHAAADDFE
jgi:hypothetical protein